MDKNITKEECLEIVSTITKPYTKDEKINFFKAITYVRENLKSLDNKDLKAIVDNEQFMEKIGDDYKRKLNHRYTNFNLISMNKEKCLDIFSSSYQPQTKDSKLDFHLALTYFKENLMSFDKDELKKVLSNDYVKKNIGQKFDQEVMTQCIKSKKSFPITLPSWESGFIREETLEAYIDLINSENNEEQLEFFCQHKLRHVTYFVYLDRNISPLLAEIYLKYNAKYIFVIDWSEEKKCSWLENNKNLINEIFAYLCTYEKDISSDLKDKIYNCVIEKLFVSEPKPEDLIFANFILANNSSDFLKYLRKNHSNELKELLSFDIEHINRSDIRLNLAQYFIEQLSIEHNDASKVLFQIICDNKELLLKPIKVQTRLYETEISFFEHGLKNSYFLMFSPFHLNDVTESQHKEAIVAAAFCMLQAKHDAFDTSDDGYSYGSEITNYDHMKKWYPYIIEQATPEQLNRYCDRALKGNESNSALAKELDVIKLRVELNNDLSSDNTTPKFRHKI